MELKKLEITITDLKSKVGAKKEEGSDLSLSRKTKKCLKRAQRKKRVMVKQAENLLAKSKKKEEAAS
ncbi:hypothetical protein MNBD_NITROSPIRAE01-381 [hydrothermal vent metagenome]|uniref:Uncharacterized protein n=1 Tax=hydrothermal vent metagenome TaxID=652676 RepID=A0A3B1CAF4_9ZZZZ